MFKEINLEKWARKDHFEFFRKFDEPFFGITAEVDCTDLYSKSKREDNSFFLLYLYSCLKAANQIEAFRYRIKGEKVLLYDEIHASPTINRPDGTFGFSYMRYQERFKDFHTGAIEEIERVRSTTGLEPALSGQNVIHFSSLPWINFTSLSHARSFSFEDSCPKISIGKMTEKGGRRIMPVAVHVHHALVDGYHVGQFFQRLEELMT